MKKRILGILLGSMVIYSAMPGNGTRPQITVSNVDISTSNETLEETESSSDISKSNFQVSDQPIYEYEIRELYASRDENQIYGIIYIPQNAGDKMPAIIYSHGFGGSHQYGTQYAEAMAARGYVVYCFDFCGGSPTSRSDGSQYEMSIFTEEQDLENVIEMIQKLNYVDEKNIFLLGSSQGGAVSAMTAADHKEEIAGAVLLYPAFVIVDNAMEQFDTIEDVPETYFHMFMEVGRTYFEGLFDYDIYEDIKAYDKDVLIIHGDEDSIVPVSYSERAIEVYPSAQLKVISGAGHGFSGEDAQSAISYMTEYYNSHLNR